MSAPITEWRWVQRYAEQFGACNLRPGETAVLLSEAASRPLIVETARLALESMGAAVADVRMPTPANPGPVPIRSTGASVALAGHRAAIAALAAADFVVDCTAEGLLHAPELGEILAGGARVLMISAEHPENAERWPHDPALADRVAHGVALLAGGRGRWSITSAAGTEPAGGLLAGAVTRRLARLVHRARQHRPLARRIGSGLPRRAQRQRHAGAGTR